MSGENIACTVEDDGIWAIGRVCELLRRIDEHAPLNGDIEIYLPHTAFLFGKLVKLSDRVSRIRYLEEGYTSAQALLLTRGMPAEPVNLPSLEKTLDAGGLIDAWRIDRNALAWLNDIPASFFDIHNRKCTGSFAFSPDAFSGMTNVTRLALSADQAERPEQLVSFASIINRCGGHADQKESMCRLLLVTAERMLAESNSENFKVIKLHPRDRQGLPDWFYKALRQLGHDYFDYCNAKGVDHNLEPALLNFNHYYIFGRTAQTKYVEALWGAGRMTVFEDLA